MGKGHPGYWNVRNHRSARAGLYRGVNRVHFFFSSRRRHTRLTCDWSSDVCSSDLTLTPASLALAIENAHLTDLRVIGDENQDGVEGWYSTPFFVLKDSPIKTVED